MTFPEFREAIQSELRRTRAGLTWVELRERLGLPYDRPCPEWTRRLEEEIGLSRLKEGGRSLVWKVAPGPTPAESGKESEFFLARAIALNLPEVEEGTLHGVPAWRLGGRLLAYPAIHKSAEAGSLLVKIAPSERERLLSAAPDAYYLTDHYECAPVVLVRLARVNRTSLQALLEGAWRFVSEGRNARTGGKARLTAPTIPRCP